MTARDTLLVAGAVTAADEARLALGGLLAHQGPAAMDVRTGVLAAPATTTLLVGTAGMTVNVAACNIVTSKGSTNGPYVGTNDGTVAVTVAAAPGSNSRIDVIWYRQQDAAAVVSADASTVPEVGITTGTAAASPTKPAIPNGATELGTVKVFAGATRTDTGTGSSGVTLTTTAQRTVAAGGILPVASKAERDAVTAHEGMAAFRTDLRMLEVLGAGAGVLRAVYAPPLIQFTAGALTGVQTNTTQGLHGTISPTAPFGVGTPFQGIVLTFVLIQAVTNTAVVQLGATASPGTAGKRSSRFNNTSGTTCSATIVSFDIIDSGASDTASYQPIVTLTGSATFAADERYSGSVMLVVPKAL